jgi:hypothetical protein
VEGNSIRSISRVAKVSINTVAKLLEDAGDTCLAIHNETVRGVNASRIQWDEIWSFNHGQQRNAAEAAAAPMEGGDVWTWTARDADTQLIVAYAAGERTTSRARLFMADLEDRVSDRAQITADGHRAVVEAIDDAVDCTQRAKIAKGGASPAGDVGAKTRTVTGEPDEARVPAADVRRCDPSIRLGSGRFTSPTNTVSRKIDNHLHALALFFCHANFCRVDNALKVTPGMAAGVTDRPWSLEMIAERIAANRPRPGKRGPYRKSASVSHLGLKEQKQYEIPLA